MNGFVFVIAAVSVVFAIAAIFLGKLKKRWLKYIPAILAFASAIALMIKAYRFSEGFEALGYFILMILALIVFVVALITAVIVEIIGVRKRRAGRGTERKGPDGGGPEIAGSDGGRPEITGPDDGGTEGKGPDGGGPDGTVG
jgi:hypothetical protein